MAGPTPLLGLDAVVIDTETTGLDAAKARIVQFGAVALHKGGRQAAPVFDRKVNPNEPIPAATTKVHGITQAMVENEPEFAGVFPDFLGFIGDRVLIGHNIGFDLAVIQAECGRARIKAPESRVLDTRLLAEICFPNLAGFTLDKLAAHLGITIIDRHDALSDAIATADVFLGLVPHLKEHGIRTLAEAEAACRRLTAVLDQYQRAGWAEPVRFGGERDGALGRIDAYPFKHRVQDVARVPPVIAPEEMTLAAAAATMTEAGISALFVGNPTETDPTKIGIITERDLLHRVGREGAKVLDAPIGSLANRPILTVPAEAFIYRAIGRMDHYRIRHLGVTDAGGRLIGAISSRDLLRLRASDALALGDTIDTAKSVPELALAWSRMARVAEALLEEGVPAPDCAAVVSREIGALTRWAAIEAERRLVNEGMGPAPVAYAVLVLGSGGRGESLLIPDQDNAIVYADGADDANAERWFARLGESMTAILDQIGIPLCKGGVMARNPEWRGSLRAWKARIEHWSTRTNPKDLLTVDIFYDFRAVHGDLALAEALQRFAFSVAHEARALAKLLAADLENWSPPVGMFGGIKTENGRVDLKRFGLFPIVAAARCLAMSHGFASTATASRIQALRDAQIGADSDLERLMRSQNFLMRTIFRQQVADIRAGRPPSNSVEVKALPKPDQDLLKDILSSLGEVPMLVKDLLFAH